MSGIFLSEACSALPLGAFLLMVIGGAVVYALSVFLMYQLFKLIFENIDMEALMIMAFFWPIAIVVGVAASIIYYVGNYLAKLLIIQPLFGVDKSDLVRFERKVERKIDASEANVKGAIDSLVETYHPPKAVKKAKKKVSKKKQSKKAKK